MLSHAGWANSIRQPAVAGLFYPAREQHCRAEAQNYLSLAATRTHPPVTALPPLSGGIVPHAGWVYSGAIAARTLTLTANGAAPGPPPVETFIIFGAMHRPRGTAAAVYASGSWQTPLGPVAIDEPLARAILDATPLLIEDPASHAPEHSIEVEVPFLQMLAGHARLLPILVPPARDAAAIGRVVAAAARRIGRRVMFLGSSDLTHYGPRYAFEPAGSGAEGFRWAKEVNDRRLLDLITTMQTEQIVPSAREHQSACGPGAIAAAMAACGAMGATRGILLEHTSSAEVIASGPGATADAVGYAAVVFC